MKFGEAVYIDLILGSLLLFERALEAERMN